MRSQIIIQILLILAVAAVGWMMLRTPGGARHQAGRRLVTLAFVLFAVVAIATPTLMTRVANMVGVGRGADLLLYALVIAFLAEMLSAFRRNAARERQITRLARRIALDQAPEPPEGTRAAAGRPEAPGAAGATGAARTAAGASTGTDTRTDRADDGAR